jgi:hypothetical protein
MGVRSLFSCRINSSARMASAMAWSFIAFRFDHRLEKLYYTQFHLITRNRFE